jgi:hypothetical protein
MTNPRISDIPSIQKALEDMRNLKNLKVAMPILRPFLRLLGTNVDQLEEELAKVEDLERMAAELATIPDRFNDLFASRGWIIYDILSLDVVRSALQKAESGDIDGAETDLVNHFSPDTVQEQLQLMISVKAFRPRLPLARKALIDYREERYHACVPVVLALLDGMVNELHEKRRGFFADGVNLEAWDSIAAHSKGLNQLVKTMTPMRQNTTTDPITVPYRNGILHGMHLGYDNKIVAAKSWAALFAARDWALKAERGLLTAPPEKPKMTLAEAIQLHRENQDDEARINARKSRTISIGVDIPATGEPSLFEADTPEHRLAEFMSYWKTRNYGYMARCLPRESGYPVARLPARLRQNYGTKHLKTFSFVEIDDNAPAITDVLTHVVYEESGQVVEKSVKFTLLNENAKGRAVVRGKPDSKWVVFNWYALPPLEDS